MIFAQKTYILLLAKARNVYPALHGHAFICIYLYLRSAGQTP